MTLPLDFEDGIDSDDFAVTAGGAVVQVTLEPCVFWGATVSNQDIALYTEVRLGCPSDETTLVVDDDNIGTMRAAIGQSANFPDFLRGRYCKGIVAQVPAGLGNARVTVAWIPLRHYKRALEYKDRRDTSRATAQSAKLAKGQNLGGAGGGGGGPGGAGSPPGGGAGSGGVGGGGDG